MLVLTREANGVIVIGDPPTIRIMVIEIRGGKCRLGIDAPKDIAVHRLEVHEAIQRQRAADGVE